MVGKGVVSDEEDEIGVDEEERELLDDEEGGGQEEEEDEEDEDEGQDEFEKDGFIVDDVDEDEVEEREDDGDSGEERQKKKKRRKRESDKNYVLDDDDYMLLEDNNITGFHRPRTQTKKFKRLKKAQMDTEEGQSAFSDEEVFDDSGKGGRTAEEKLKHRLFGDDEGRPLEDIAEDEEQPEEDEDIGDDDEMADFIVDEEEVDENGAPVRRRKLNKKKHRQAPGVSSSALEEAHDIFGDVEELINRRKVGLDSTEWKERRLEDEFEPSVLSDKYMTEKDEMIRATDIPERMQVSEEGSGSPLTNAMSIEEESSWIHNQLAAGMLPLLGTGAVTDEGYVNSSIDKDAITRFLEYVHIQKLDVPYIAMYRKEDLQILLKDLEEDEMDVENQETRKIKWHRLLWVIQDLDRKWTLLQKRKSTLHAYYNKRFEEESRRVYDETRLALNRQLFESIFKSLKAAESEREVDDVDCKFNLHFPPNEVGLEEGQYKRPKRKSQYSICSKAGLWEVASKFGYSSEQFGLQISLANMNMDELEDAKETPEEMASNFTCAMFETSQAALKGARHMATVEISCEPSVRKHIRSIFMDNAVVSTKPTVDGNMVIDPSHRFAGIKWLSGKPLTKFEDAQWLLIQKAEEDKLLNVTIKLPEHTLNKFLGDSKDYYLSGGVSKSAQLWNEQRKLILEDAIFNFLLPSMEKEARSLLTSKAKTWLLLEYGKVLWDKVSVAPYQQKENAVNSDEGASLNVMACCWGPGKPATTFVMLDSSGEILDVLYTSSLTLRSQNVNDQQCKKNDQQRVLKFITDHQPHVVVIGAANLSCARLKDDIFEIIFEKLEEDPRDAARETDDLKIVYGDESLARLYENSQISVDQLPGQPGIVRRAVALGRYLQNPLAMAATLCGPLKEILSWKLHTLEGFLLPDEKYGMIEQVFVDVVNQVGIDINLAASHEWLFAPLQFISGLGPRKAASLQRSLVRAGAIFTRKDFVTSHGVGKKVFVNAVGFLRVRRSGLAASSSQYIDLLDDTRIHPESYSLAQQLAKDVYKASMGSVDNDEDDDDMDDDMEMAIEHVRDNPSSLKSIDINEYLISKKRENKRETFSDIQLELIRGFQDRRKQYEELNQDEEFYMISGETKDTLCEGKVVQATVRRVQNHRAFCGLDSGLTGMLSNKDYSDDSRGFVDLTGKLREGDLLTCKIKSIQKSSFFVLLSYDEKETASNQCEILENRDPYYCEDKSSQLAVQENALKDEELARRHFKPRMIVHPRFQNITADEATKYLSDKEPGESIMRPSSRGPYFLTLTIKVYDGVYAHKDIVEGGKEHKDITSLLRLGKTLKIDKDTFEDLDEVVDRYLDPLVANLKAMLNYRKFRRGSKAEVDELLRKEKTEYPMRIVYSLSISEEHPGTFILTYIRSSNPHHEYISIYPKGFKFRANMFSSIDRLIAYFQRHINDPPIQQSVQSVSARVAMPSPAGRGSPASSWGGSVIGDETGWKEESGNREGSETPGRNDYRNGGRGRHGSGAPRPYGGRGRGRGRGNERPGSDYGTPKWGPASKEGGDDGWGSFPGAKVHNSPGREAFPGGWGGSAGWGSKEEGGNVDSGAETGSGGWAAAAAKKTTAGAGWSGASDNSGWGGGGGGW